MNQTILYLPGLSPVAGKDLCARFDGGRLSSDGGVLVLREIERRLGICDLLASCMPEGCVHFIPSTEAREIGYPGPTDPALLGNWK